MPPEELCAAQAPHISSHFLGKGACSCLRASAACLLQQHKRPDTSGHRCAEVAVEMLEPLLWVLAGADTGGAC